MIVISPCRKCIVQACCSQECGPYKGWKKHKYDVSYYTAVAFGGIAWAGLWYLITRGIIYFFKGEL
jgi:hypothetical protein